MSRPIAAIAIATAFALAAAPARAAPGDAAVADFCRQHLAEYKELIKWTQEHTRKRDPPQVPVPPKLALPCRSCDDAAEKTDAEKAAQAFVEGAMEPEASKMLALAKIARSRALFAEAGTTGGCLGDVSAADAAQAAVTLADRIYTGKAIAMAERYEKDPDLAYAGVELLYAASKQRLIAHGLLDEKNAPTGDDALSHAATWMTTLHDTMNRRIFKEYRYELCPTYAEVIRDWQLLAAGNGSSDDAAVEQLMSAPNKLNAFLNFRVQLDWDGTGEDGHGSILHVRFHGEGKLHVPVELAHSCFRTDPVGELHVDVTAWEGHDEKGNAVEYVGPKSYVLPVKSVKLSLCAKAPELSLELAETGPKVETFTHKGSQATTTITAESVQALLAHEGVQSAADAASGGDLKAMQQRVQKLQQKMRDHRNDPAWKSTPEGQETLQGLMDIASPVLGARPGAAPSGGAPGHTIRVGWTNGSRQPVQKKLHFQTGKADFTLNVSVQQETLPGK